MGLEAALALTAIGAGGQVFSGVQAQREGGRVADEIIAQTESEVSRKKKEQARFLSKQKVAFLGF